MAKELCVALCHPTGVVAQIGKFAGQDVIDDADGAEEVVGVKVFVHVVDVVCAGGLIGAYPDDGLSAGDDFEVIAPGGLRHAFGGLHVAVAQFQSAPVVAVALVIARCGAGCDDGAVARIDPEAGVVVVEYKVDGVVVEVEGQAVGEHLGAVIDGLRGGVDEAEGVGVVGDDVDVQCAEEADLLGAFEGERPCAGDVPEVAGPPAAARVRDGGGAEQVDVGHDGIGVAFQSGDRAFREVDVREVRDAVGAAPRLLRFEQGVAEDVDDGLAVVDGGWAAAGHIEADAVIVAHVDDGVAGESAAAVRAVVDVDAVIVGGGDGAVEGACARIDLDVEPAVAAAGLDHADGVAAQAEAVLEVRVVVIVDVDVGAVERADEACPVVADDGQDLVAV